MTSLFDRTFPVVLSGPSGSGKTTVIRELLSRRNDLRFSVSATTREARLGERPGVHYVFHDREEFERRCEHGEMLEWADVHGQLYGTPRENLERATSDGVHLLLDIDVQGARAVRTAVPEAATIFLLPPSGAWLTRLRSRGSETGPALERRLRTAEEELTAAAEFDYAIVNDKLADTVRRVESILDGEESRTARVGRELDQLVSVLENEISAARSEAAK